MDDDGNILSPIYYDIFVEMERNHRSYGYLSVGGEGIDCVKGLWELTQQFSKNHNINQDVLNRLPEGNIYYNNFEVLRMSLFRSQKNIRISFVRLI